MPSSVRALTARCAAPAYPGAQEVPPVEIGEQVRPASRAEWRRWLEAHHASAKEIWLVTGRTARAVSYLEAVEEALCFGWIDGIAKRLDEAQLAQRFTPRRKGSHWTELNKARARRLIDQGRMTEAGRAALPDLTVRPVELAPDLQAALEADPVVWRHYQAFSEHYRRIRIGYIEEMRGRPAEFQKRLGHFVAKTRQNKPFGVME
ncbi:YdeI/OmpD-associated family protein [Deinococcus aquaedulcis]|uniref:YdeI/OmpD-associated family protein n=1 Tax=Deinococcus aquaedulcis TaxID=2840455 RepID=UPI001C82B32A|nr:YdeI/OmpD-associated family protein [Deinococcus aquaedulcis]